MRGTLGRHALVIGAGVGGTLAARVLSEHFERVTLLERDRLPSGSGFRKGIPQARHVHAILRGGLDAMNKVFPGLERELYAAGALAFRPPRDLVVYDGVGLWPSQDTGPIVPAQTRALLDEHLQSRVAQRPNIDVVQCIVRELSVAGGRVDGVLCESDMGPQHLPAELVVDASGRSGQALRWFKHAGFPVPSETRIEVRVEYASCMFAVPDDAPNAFGALVNEPPPDGRRGGLLHSQEGRRYICSLATRGGGRPPDELTAFREFARGLPHPAIYDLIRAAEPLGPISRFSFQANVHRHYERLPEFPEGFLPIGDAICTFNPIWGQGMSVAALQAVALSELLSRRPVLDGLWRDFFPAAATIIATPWVLSAGPDLAFDATTGERPPGSVQRRAFLRALAALAQRDHDVRGLLADIFHLTAPLEALSRPELVSRVLPLMQQTS